MRGKDVIHDGLTLSTTPFKSRIELNYPSCVIVADGVGLLIPNHSSRDMPA